MTLRIPARTALMGVAALLVLGLLAAALAPLFAASHLRAAARARGLAASWRRLALTGPARVRLRGLVLRSLAAGDTLLAVDDVDVALRPLALLTGHVQPARIEMERARLALPTPP